MSDLEKVKCFLADEGIRLIHDETLANFFGDPIRATCENAHTIVARASGITVPVLLHEYGHCVCGLGCCREHDEIKAQGAARAAAKRLEIDLPLEEDDHVIKHYAGRSQCPLVASD